MRQRLNRLTPHEAEIVRLLVTDGLCNKEIAAAMQCAEKTIKSHMTNIFRKTGCTSRVELVIKATKGDPCSPHDIGAAALSEV